MPRFGSEEDTKSGEARTPLAEDRYLLEVLEFEVTSEPDNFNNGKPRDVGKTKLLVISCADGSVPVMITDEELPEDDERFFFEWIEITRTGFSKGRPSKARQFLAACFGQSTADALEFDDWKELLGKRLIGQAVVKPDKDGIKRNKCIGYEPVKARRVRSAAPSASATQPEPPLPTPPVDLAAKGKEIFGEDADFGA